MSVQHSIAAALAGVLLIQSAGLAQTRRGRMDPTEPPFRRIAVPSVEVGMDLRFDLDDGRRIEGRLIEKSDDDLVVEVAGRRHTFPAAAVIAVAPLNRQRLQRSRDLSDGISVAIILGVLLVYAVGHRH